MKLLGIDYGRRKIGLAIGDTDSRFAEPLAVVRFNVLGEAVKRVFQFASIQKVERLILGISEGAMASETQEFAEKLRKETNLPVSFQDETLTTHSAQELSKEAGIRRKKRKEKEDSFSAALILQAYLENIG